MNNLSEYILEKFRISKETSSKEFFPKNKIELVEIIINKVKKNGVRHVFHGDLNDIDTSAITDMSGLMTIAHKNFDFKLERRLGNVDMSEWDVSNVINAQSMFFGCKSFNSDLSNWDVRNLENATAMFAGCEELDFDISKWNAPKLKKSQKTWKMITNTKLKHQDWMRE